MLAILGIRFNSVEYIHCFSTNLENFPSSQTETLSPFNANSLPPAPLSSLCLCDSDDSGDLTKGTHPVLVLL